MSSIRIGICDMSKKICNWAWLYVCFAGLFPAPDTLKACQDLADEPGVEIAEPANEGLVTVVGQFVNKPSQLKDFVLTELKGSLVQSIEFKQPEMPADWPTMTVEQRQKWITDFEASENGKLIIATNQKLIADRAIIELEIESDGKFVAYDVPHGQFNLQAMAEREQDGMTYIVQAFGQITIGDVDEVQLGLMPLEVVRFLKMQELAPEISGKTFAGEQASLTALRGKYVLLNFAALRGPAFENTVNAIKEAMSRLELADKLSVLTVSIDEDAEATKKLISEKAMDWPCIALGGWDAAVLNSYGVKSVPSLWLIDPDGKIVLTGQQFLYELGRTGSPLPKLVDDVIAGRVVIGENADGTTSDGVGDDDKEKSKPDDGRT